MYTIQQTHKFSQWLIKLKDMRARIAIARRLERAQGGNLGDVKSVGERVFEKGDITMETQLSPFDMTQYLDSEEAIAEYLTQVLEEGDTDELIRAIGHIAKARGMSQIAQESGLGRESLYKTFAPGSKPRFDTIAKVVKSLGLHFHITPLKAS